MFVVCFVHYCVTWLYTSKCICTWQCGVDTLFPTSYILLLVVKKSFMVLFCLQKLPKTLHAKTSLHKKKTHLFCPQVLQTGQEITELDSSGFATECPTLHTANMGDGRFMIQVNGVGVNVMYVVVWPLWPEIVRYYQGSPQPESETYMCDRWAWFGRGLWPHQLSPFPHQR